MFCLATRCTRELRDHEADQYLCMPCVRTIRGWLAELHYQLIVLREGSMHREVTGSRTRSGTRSAPMAPREDTLNLAGPAAPGDVRDEHGDQCGPIPIIGVLGSWSRIILEENPNAPQPDRWTEDVLADWLGQRLGWAARQSWVGEMCGELGDMIHAVRRITKVRPQKRPISRPCPRCSCLTLTKEDHDLYVRCGNETCEAVYTEAELNDDAQRRAAAVREEAAA